uniref:Uncharacterized protein n=1 Tax=Oryza sativa subsp. japonica TaxID=39947 RepID=Q94H39_ORYSJ|nr:hypothetical protein [Oryza sativa Japonica Group]
MKWVPLVSDTRWRRTGLWRPGELLAGAGDERWPSSRCSQKRKCRVEDGETNGGGIAGCGGWSQRRRQRERRDLGDVGGAMAWSAEARVDRNGEVADGGALDTESGVELGTRDSPSLSAKASAIGASRTCGRKACEAATQAPK